jgi:FlaA1/EpsC-like NDP-sugar epimerase
VILIIDLSAVYFAFLIAYVLRYNFVTDSFEARIVLKQGFIAMGVYLVFMLVFRSYSGMIRHTTLKDTYKIIYTNLISGATLFLLTILAREFNLNYLLNISGSILLIHFSAVTIFMFFFRVGIRVFYEFALSTSHNRKNVLIYGSGEVGILVKRVIEGDPDGKYRLKGFIDDNKKLQGKSVDGFPVYSRNVLNKEFIEHEEIHGFIIAIKNIEPLKKREVLESMIDLGCEILDIPSFDTWLNGQFDVKKLKKVEFEDLLGREPIKLNLERIEAGLKGKTILVTGAAGSIGSEIARQLIRFDPRLLILIDQAETPSFYLNEQLKDKCPVCNYKIIIGDVTGLAHMEKIFLEYKPEIIFHAAAYKHVPVMEQQPHEAFRINVGGTKIMTDLSIKYGIEKFVLVSSDKAVNPTNVMGATKKVCELLVQAQSRRKDNKTQFIVTRFGNVLGSNGSVIPLFNKQIAEGGPVTLTHPDITRYFMTIPEACQLVLEAGFMGNGGQIFVFDMGEPIRIADIANNLIRLSGLEPGKDIKIKYTGLRPGEKLYEELFTDNEALLPTHNSKINIARANHIDSEGIMSKIDHTLKLLYKLDCREVILLMKELVPEYSSRQVIETN